MDYLLAHHYVILINFLHVTVMDNILNLLVEKLMSHIQDLNVGHTIDPKIISEC
jgi:hypothetical protein